MGLSRLDVDDAAHDALGALVGAAYELVGVIRQLERSKRQRDDHAQQLIHDVQRRQVGGTRCGRSSAATLTGAAVKTIKSLTLSLCFA